MLSLRKLADTEPNRLLYIERFQLNKTIPETLIMTVKNYICDKRVWGYCDELFIAKECSFVFSFLDAFMCMIDEKAVDTNWIDEVTSELGKKINISEFESVINKVLEKHKYYTAGEYIENDIWREETNENRDR